MVATTSAPPTRDSYGIRQEVLDFILIAEALLSPRLPSHTLTEKECGLIAEYVTSLSCSGHPWSNSLPIRYNI